MIGVNDWIKNKLLENNNDCKLVKGMFDQFKSDIPESIGTKESFEKMVIKFTKKIKESDFEIIEENVSLAKKLQKEKDLNRIHNKGFREYARIENGIKKYNKSLIESLQKNDLNKITINHESLNCKIGGVIQLSDLHFNELISIAGNEYDFTVAAKRLKLFAIQIKSYFKPLSITGVLIAFTGDLLNSDRRIDEILNQSTNRSDATVLAFYLLKQFIIDLNLDFNISIASVSGNESRIMEEPGWSEIVSRDNFDYTIENFLRVQFSECPGIKFIDGDAKEKVVSIAGQNILLLHGEKIHKNTQTSVQQKIGAYALKGIMIHYAIFGHYHSAHLGDFSSRSSSMAGSNSYNEYSLGLIGRASQNIYMFYENGNRDAIKVDLQNTSDIEGYEIHKNLEAYNAKSTIKTNNRKTIMEIII